MATPYNSPVIGGNSPPSSIKNDELIMGSEQFTLPTPDPAGFDNKKRPASIRDIEMAHAQEQLCKRNLRISTSKRHILAYTRKLAKIQKNIQKLMYAVYGETNSIMTPPKKYTFADIEDLLTQEALCKQKLRCALTPTTRKLLQRELQYIQNATNTTILEVTNISIDTYTKQLVSEMQQLSI
jgi:hypothetical protein